MNKNSTKILFSLITILAISYFVFLFPKLGEASYTDHTIYNLGTIHQEYYDHYDNSALQLVPQGGNRVITYIKYRVRNTGSYEHAHIEVWLAHGRNGNDAKSGNGSTVIQLLNDYNNLVPNDGQWRTFSRSFSSNEGPGILRLLIESSSNQSLNYDVEVLEVRYREYSWEDIHLEITPEKYVKIVASKPESVPNTHVKVTNTVTGQVFEIRQSSNKTITFIDTSVEPGKYYYYSFKSEVGYYAENTLTGYYPLPINYSFDNSLTLGILCPSDAQEAKMAAEQARDMLNGSANGGKSLAATYDKANDASQDTAYIRNTQFPELQNKIDSMQTSITNIQNSLQGTDETPPTVDVQTASGARATSASSIEAIVTVTDNKPGPYTYAIDDDSYSTLPSNGHIDLPVSRSGNNSITVNVKDAAGNIGSKAITIRKL